MYRTDMGSLEQIRSLWEEKRAGDLQQGIQGNTWIYQREERYQLAFRKQLFRASEKPPEKPEKSIQ